jgi:tRNA(fMet)-specific endonuclease VapC
MLVLDTDHLTELGYRTEPGLRLEDRLHRSKEDVIITVVTAEEAMKGRLARLAATNDVAEQVAGYQHFARTIHLIAEFTLLPWDDESAARFKQLRGQGVRIGTADLKIACIAIEHEALLLTRNTVDFAKVPGLRFENWLE